MNFLASWLLNFDGSFVIFWMSRTLVWCWVMVFGDAWNEGVGVGRSIIGVEFIRILAHGWFIDHEHRDRVSLLGIGTNLYLRHLNHCINIFFNEMLILCREPKSKKARSITRIGLWLRFDALNNPPLCVCVLIVSRFDPRRWKNKRKMLTVDSFIIFACFKFSIVPILEFCNREYFEYYSDPDFRRLLRFCRPPKYRNEIPWIFTF